MEKQNQQTADSRHKSIFILNYLLNSYINSKQVYNVFVILLFFAFLIFKKIVFDYLRSYIVKNIIFLHFQLPFRSFLPCFVFVFVFEIPYFPISNFPTFMAF